jgi:hypothetical protein
VCDELDCRADDFTAENASLRIDLWLAGIASLILFFREGIVLHFACFPRLPPPASISISGIYTTSAASHASISPLVYHALHRRSAHRPQDGQQAMHPGVGLRLLQTALSRVHDLQRALALILALLLMALKGAIACCTGMADTTTPTLPSDPITVGLETSAWRSTWRSILSSFAMV